MKHIIRPYEDQSDPPIDMNDPIGAFTAIEIRFPESFSKKAWRVIDYFEGAAFLYVYKGKFVVTDESLYLTMHGDGTNETPFGGPRAVCETIEAVERWLEQVADEYDKDGSIPEWEAKGEDKPSEPELPKENPVKPDISKVWVIAEMFSGLLSDIYCVKSKEQVELCMKEFIHNSMLDHEPLTCVFAEEYISCTDAEQKYEFTAKLTNIDETLPTHRTSLTDPYMLHPLPLYDVCVEAMEHGFYTVYDSRTLVHTPLNEFAEAIDAADHDDIYGYVRFGPIIVGLTDAWEKEAEIYELE